MKPSSTSNHRKNKNKSTDEYDYENDLQNSNSSFQQSDETDISAASRHNWIEKEKSAIRNIKNKSFSIDSTSTSPKNSSIIEEIENLTNSLDNTKESENSEVRNIKTKSIELSSENNNSRSNSSKDWEKKNIEAIANAPLFNKEKRFYGDGTTSEEPHSDLRSSSNYSSSYSRKSNHKKNIKNKEVLNIDDLTSASSFIESDQSSTASKKRNKKVKKNKSKASNSFSSNITESESDTLSKNERNSFYAYDDSNGSKIYFNSEASDAPAVRKIKNKIDNLITPRSPNAPFSTRSAQVRYTEDEWPRRRQKVAQIFLEEESEIVENSSESDLVKYGRLQEEHHAHNVTDSEISDISLVDFDTPKVKYAKSPTKQLVNGDDDFAFKKNQLKHENNFSSSSSTSFQGSGLESSDSEDDEEISNEAYKAAVRKIEKFEIDDEATPENGSLFDIRGANQEEEGQLLLNLKKNAIMLSSSSSQKSDTDDPDKIEMLGEMVVNGGLPFLKLSDGESDSGRLAEEEEEEGVKERGGISILDEELSSEPPIMYDQLLAPKALTTPRTPRTPNEPVYTGNLALSITVIEAVDLPKSMPKMKLQPYVIFKLKGKKESKKTKTCRFPQPNAELSPRITPLPSPKSSPTPSPKYSPKFNSYLNTYPFEDEKIDFVIDPNEENILSICVRGEDKFAGDFSISGYDYNLSSLNVGESSDGWFRLKAAKNNAKGGKLHVRFDLVRETKPEPPHTPRLPKPQNERKSSSNHSQNSRNSNRSENSANSPVSNRSKSSINSADLLNSSQDSEEIENSEKNQSSQNKVDINSISEDNKNELSSETEENQEEISSLASSSISENDEETNPKSLADSDSTIQPFSPLSSDRDEA